MTTRINPYKDIHKGLRRILLELLQQAGTTVAEDETGVRELHLQFVRVLDLLDIHSEIEDSLLAPLIDAAGGEELRQQIDADHDQLHRDITALDDQLRSMQNGGASAEQGLQFYLSLSDFVGAQLQHMAREETLIWPLLHRHCDDEQMLQVQTRARQMMPPAAMQMLLRAMIPALNAAERQLMLGNMQKSLTEQAFAGICALSRSVLPEPEWLALENFLAAAATA